MIKLDGSYLEGGGQIFRNALSLSCILQNPVEVYNIRANRPNPGLSHQHLECLKLLQQITSATVSGNQLKSTKVTFQPGPIRGGKYMAKAETAASISLMLQCALPVVAFGNGHSHLELTGGTNVKMAPQIDYMTEVMRPLQHLFGISYDFELHKRGYYPRGGGRCIISVQALTQLNSVKLTTLSNEIVIDGWCFVAGNLPLHLAEDMKKSAEKVLKQLNYPLDIMAYKENAKIATDNGSGLVLRATSATGCVLGSDALGEKRIIAHELGEQAANELLIYLKNDICVDHWAQDQLILYMALAKGESTIKTCKITNHTKTAIWVAERMTDVKFNITEANNNEAIITCRGLGVINNNIV